MIKTVFAFVSCLLILPANGMFSHEETADSSSDLIAAGNNSFAVDLYKELVRKDENVFFSPLSIYYALTMAAGGARNETALEFGEVLRYPETLKTGRKDIPWDMNPVHASLSALEKRYEFQNESEVLKRLDRLERAYLDSIITVYEVPEGVDTSKYYADIITKEREASDRLEEARDSLPNYEFRLANSLWVQKGFPIYIDYIDTIKRFYAGEGIFPADFINHSNEERKLINAWIEKQTKGRIKDAIPLIAPLTRLILVNAIYFLGEWQEPFEEENTKEADFTLASGAVLETAMMENGYLHKARYAAFNEDGSFFHTPEMIKRGRTEGLYPGAGGFAVAELPYKDCDLSMLIISPNSPDGLPDIESRLSSDELSSWEDNLRPRAVHVIMPKLKMICEYHIVHDLEELGLKLVFDPSKADLSGISEIKGDERLYVSDAVHKTFLEVDEKGTEAAAVTYIMIAITRSMSKDDMIPFTPVFRADRPFLFFIRDRKSGLILFMGRVENPKTAEGNY